MWISPNTRQLVGGLNPSQYSFVATVYFASTIVLIASLSASWYHHQRYLFTVFLVDIAAIIILADASGGMVSGLPILLVITVAASAVMISNSTIATLVAALSVLAVLLLTLRLIVIQQASINELFPAGLLGLLLFVVSLLVQAIARRLSRVEDLAQRRASDLYNLQRLNEQVVQHMQTGILLVNSERLVRVMNKAAIDLLAPGRSVTSRHLHEYSDQLAEQFEHWKSTGQHRAQPFSVHGSPTLVIANFRDLRSENSGEAIIFIEDYTPITQHAQALKLSSLGRLTASIAHEIRNPLGAISHAAQLLQESEALATADQRLADIIQEHSSRVNRIVENVMQISRREPPKPEYLLLGEWLLRFVEDYLDTLHRDAEVSVDCDYRDLVIEFDPENLRRILSNLLDNGLRHSALHKGQERAHIEVSLNEDTEQCLIDVIDEGPGVAPEDEEKLFEPFFTTVESGSGMGLYLCKELCEINNATLNYLRTKEGQSCFRLALNKRALN
ncbi:HAMP domain-containing histidine kinase [Parahaliea sp. F7430]|uniref:histidine kinase n=2 Tax=Sediminihaliea albiluteola TaxID=2758564 RepID=A0A7W2TYL0_9GAMM|nr:HAMP domain-containing histidine kinase [Sediminihaliea albiluteola]